MRDKKETVIKIRGIDCADCAVKIEKAVSKAKGVKSAEVSFVNSTLRIKIDNSEFNRKNIENIIQRLGYSVEPKRKGNSLRLYVEGMDCSDESSIIEKRLNRLKGIKDIKFYLVSRELEVEYDPEVIKPAEIVASINQIGMKASIKTEFRRGLSFWDKRKHLILTMASGILAVTGIILSRLEVSQDLTTPIFILAIIIGGFYIARKGIAAFRTLSLDMNFLMTIAVIGAAFIGEWTEAAVVVVLFSLAQLLENYSMDRARNAIRSLMELSPSKALVRRNGQEVEIDVNLVRIGEKIIIKPGEKIPLDGEVIKGNSYVNQAPITGESMPVEKKRGDPVFAGTINQRGSLEVKVTHLARDTTLARIIHMVEEAQAQKAPSQSFVDKFAKYYTPSVVIIAFLIATIPVFIFNQPFMDWIYRALVLLVISCPCALVISTPVTIVAGLARAARKGVLIKGGIHLENAGRLKALVFDKTGTLTKGKAEVIDIIPLNKNNKEQVLRIAAGIESRSEHHLAQAILAKAKEWELEISEPSDFQAIIGKGARAKINGEYFYIGNHRLFEENNFCTSELDQKMEKLEKESKSVVIVGNSKRALGIVVISDAIRDNCKPTLDKLRKIGIQKIAMLTGDNKGTAEAIAKELGIDEFKAELLPQDKVGAIKDFLKKYDKVAMIGDGVNDAPALAASTIGIAMGTAGTDAALETADIALMADDLSGIPFAVSLGKKALWIIKENISLALLIKAVFFALAIPGLATLWMAVFADMGASLIVIFNGMRLFKLGRKDES
ncbi:MAG: heavy metal translocating P-type ATPase [Candidatus Aminicenantia bacterium]